ncbi:hypothetical protein DPMN_035539 [Dreissena polymorpha]|uniref:Uncharacterized protein n=1 Tax=Dreissena polymorpha TaxID=45954 RepID=A0A9D4RL38_DREPO|nr:hypothetical protein DPMN_035539 [Dreissena polymorpha]
MQRELSDSYIDSISRTPRYGYDREKSYDERLDQMNPEDPFGGEYKPSGKSPRVKRSKLPKPEQKQKEAKPLRDENVLDRGFEVQVEEKKAKRRKRAKPKRSNKSGDDLKEYHVNAGYSDELDNKKISIESNGTYTRDFKAVKRRFDNPVSSDILQNETFIFSSSNGDSVPLKKVKSEITAFTKDRITRQEDMDQVSTCSATDYLYSKLCLVLLQHFLV